LRWQFEQITQHFLASSRSASFVFDKHIPILNAFVLGSLWWKSKAAGWLSFLHIEHAGLPSDSKSHIFFLRFDSL